MTSVESHPVESGRQAPGPPLDEPLRVVHVIAGLDPNDGGPSYSVPRLCAGLANLPGIEPALFSVQGQQCSNPSGAHAYDDRRFGWDHAHIPVVGRLRLSNGLRRALASTAEHTHIVHCHGLWLAPNVLAGRVARRTRRPFVVSPRGMLSPAALSFSPWKKRFTWWLAQGSVVRDAACIHVTSSAEYEEVRGLGLRNPVAIIPNGIDIPEPRPRDSARGGERSVLCLGRVHPKKGLPTLLEAWARIEPQRPEWRLRIVGPGEQGHDDELRRIAQRLRLTRVAIEDPIFGPAKLAAYREADLFVLPTLNENFGVVVAEALAAGTPVISTRGAPWSGLVREGCGWWTDQGPAALADAMLDATSKPRAALLGMGERGRRWVARDFSWERIAADMADVYAWLAGRAPAPAVVRFD